MFLDVSEDVELMCSIADGEASASDCPDSAGGDERRVGEGAGAVFLGDADPFAGVVIGEAGEDVVVVVVDGDGEGLDVVAEQGGDDLVAGDVRGLGR